MGCRGSQVQILSSRPSKTAVNKPFKVISYLDIISLTSASKSLLDKNPAAGIKKNKQTALKLYPRTIFKSIMNQ